MGNSANTKPGRRRTIKLDVKDGLLARLQVVVVCLQHWLTVNLRTHVLLCTNPAPFPCPLKNVLSKNETAQHMQASGQVKHVARQIPTYWQVQKALDRRLHP